MMTVLSQAAPFLPWLRSYRRHHFKADLIAGLTVAVVAVPQSMAYALIAGVPVQYGLYASIVPTIVAALWGSSAHLITGPTTAVSLVVFTTLSELGPVGPAAYLELAFTLALIVGAVQIVMGIARLGVFLNFISHAVIQGFSTGAAVLIGFKQLPGFLGLRLDKSGSLADGILRLAGAVTDSHPITLLLGLLTIAVVLALRKVRPRWPGTLIAMGVVGGLVAAFDLDRYGVAVIGSIPQALPPLHIPALPEAGGVVRMLPGATAIALLGLVEAVSIAKAIAGQTHQRLNVNQEFIGQGLSNLAAGLFSGYPGSGSFTRSAVNFRSSGRTPMSGIISGLAVGGVVLLAAPLAASLPVSALAGVLLVVSFEMIRFPDLKRTVRATRNDGVVLILTFLSTLMLSIEFAVYVGVLLSIGLHLAATSHPRIFSTVPESQTGKLVGSTLGRMCCQMDVLRIEGSIFFGSAAFVQDDLLRRLKSHPNMTSLLIRMHQVNNFDASGVHLLELVLGEIKQRGGGLYLSGVNTRVFEVFKNSGLAAEIGETHFRSTTGSAIRQAMRESFCPLICAACDDAVFRECPDLKKGRWEILGKNIKPRCLHEPPLSKDEELAATRGESGGAARDRIGKGGALREDSGDRR